MSTILSWFLRSSLAQAQAKKAIAWAGTAAAGFVVATIVALLQKHGFVVSPDLMTEIANLGSGVAAIVVAALTLLWNLRDAKHVAIAIEASAKVGEPVPTKYAKALAAGDRVTLPSGTTLVLGSPSPKASDAAERAETAALNDASAKGNLG